MGLQLAIHLPVAIALGIFALGAILLKAYKVFTSPVSKLPGTEVSKWTDLVWWSSFVRQSRVSTQHDLHNSYGPVARVAPNEVIISDPTAVKQIFGFGGGFLKSRFYSDLTGAQEHSSIFSTRNPHTHSQRRRLLGASMSESHLLAMESSIRPITDLAIQRMQEQQKLHGRFDMLRWWFYMATDVIGDLTFGDSFRMLEQGKDNDYILSLRTAGKIGGLTTAFPILNKLPIHYLPLRIMTARKQTADDADESIRRYRKSVEADPENARDTLFNKLWKSSDAGVICNEDLAAESRAYLVAGTDTTAYTLTYLIWELTQNLEWQNAIRAEIASLPDDFTSRDVVALPNLQHAFTETLRLHGPVQPSMPRIVPESGLVAAGHFIPSGTVVHVQSYTMHRDPAIFPNAETWDPSRWEQPTRPMNDAFLAFGAGSRVCLGKNLAMLEMNLAFAQLYKTFPAGFRADGTTAADMEHTQFFLSGPKGGKCWIKAA